VAVRLFVTGEEEDRPGIGEKFQIDALRKVNGTSRAPGKELQGATLWRSMVRTCATFLRFIVEMDILTRDRKWTFSALHKVS
jgi:hypothetical protein